MKNNKVYLFFALILSLSCFGSELPSLDLEQRFTCSYGDATSCLEYLEPAKSLEMQHEVEAQRFPLSDKNIDTYNLIAPDKGLSAAQMDKIRYIQERDVPRNWLVRTYMYLDKDFSQQTLDRIIEDEGTLTSSRPILSSDKNIRIYRVSLTLKKLIELLVVDQIKFIKITEFKYESVWDYY